MIYEQIIAAFGWTNFPFRLSLHVWHSSPSEVETVSFFDDADYSIDQHCNLFSLLLEIGINDVLVNKLWGQGVPMRRATNVMER